MKRIFRNYTGIFIKIILLLFIFLYVYNWKFNIVYLDTGIFFNLMFI